jgi:hypothetical protein
LAGEGLGGLGEFVLEAEDAFSDLVGVVEVRWGEGLAGEDREVDLDLVEPRGMAREMHEHEVGSSRSSASVILTA